MQRFWMAALWLMAAQPVWSQSQANEVQLPEIKVYGASARSSTLDMVPTVSEISGARLTRKKQSTVGETLARETGVTASFFGPNASRPVIRGLDGDRVRVLQNGMGVLDASAASQDHAVALEPLTVERMEIVRGPAALLYGSQAVGGVVNMVTSRIPEKVPQKFDGKAETRFSSTDLGRSAGVTLDAGLGSRWVMHGDAAQRAADDYHVPGYARVPPEVGEDKGRAYNSFNRTGSGALGTSYVFTNGFVGTSFSTYESSYGSTKERFTHLNVLQQRWDVAAEVRNLGFLKSVRAKNSFSHYKHDEIEGGSLNTTFKNDGDEARVDMRHQSLAGFDGVFGVQVNTFRFAADGAEKFLPTTDNASYALFFFEVRASGVLRPSFGGRVDSSSVESRNDDTFGPGVKREFTAGSFSLGLLYQLNATNALVLNSAYTERAPNYEELFAQGDHAATQIYEVGNPDLKKERSQAVELSWRHKGESGQGSVGVFLQDFQNFITLVPTGSKGPGSTFDEYDYQAPGARFYGAEAEYRQRLPDWLPGGALEMDLKADYVRGLNRSTGDHLPRVTPIRETVGLLYKADRFQIDLEVQRNEKQTLTAPGEKATNDYTFLNVGVEMPVRMPWASFSVFGRVNNVFDSEGRNHVSFLKEEAPLPGRNFIAGVQASF